LGKLEKKEEKSRAQWTGYATRQADSRMFCARTEIKERTEKCDIKGETGF
jgi:hypothetical protein